MSSPRLRAVLLVTLVIIAAHPARANIYSGNTNNGFGGAVGNGSMSVTNDGSGGLDISYTLTSGSTFAALGNDVVVYLDNSKGSGITSTTGLDDTGDGGREAVGENGSAGQSILNFGGLMAPQYGIDFENGFGDIFQINTGSTLSFIDGADPGTTSGLGLSYTVSGGTATIDIPSADFGLPSFSGDVLKLASLEVSETGFSSNEGTETLSGPDGTGHTQTLTGVDTFTLAVPEGSTLGMLACGTGILVVWRRGRVGRK